MVFWSLVSCSVSFSQYLAWCIYKHSFACVLRQLAIAMHVQWAVVGKKLHFWVQMRDWATGCLQFHVSMLKRAQRKHLGSTWKTWNLKGKWRTLQSIVMTFWVASCHTVIVSRSHATWWQRLVSPTCFMVKWVQACGHDRVHACMRVSRISIMHVPEVGSPVESQAVRFVFISSLLAAASGLRGAIFDTNRSLCGKSSRATSLHKTLS